MNDSFKLKEPSQLAQLSQLTNIMPRVVLKNIPENVADQQFKEILHKNFEGKLKDICINKLEHKYYNRNNKICFLTADSLETREKIITFFSKFEIVDPRGLKQKIHIADGLFQTKTRDQEDNIGKTLETLNHFLKFKDYFNEGKIVDFKNDEKDFLEGIFEGVTEEIDSKPTKIQDNNLNDKKPSKMVIIKKIQTESVSNSQPVLISKVVPQNEDNTIKINTSQDPYFSKDEGIEVITREETTTNYKKKSYYDNKTNYKRNYGQNDYYADGYKDKYPNDSYYEDGYYDGYDGGYSNNYNSGHKNYNNSYHNYNYKKNNKKANYK